MYFLLCRSFFLFLFLLAGQRILSQNYLPYSASQTEKNSTVTALSRNLEFSFGYAPNDQDEKLKANLGVNNLLLKRVGIYTSLEYGLQEHHLINICGGTISINRYLYVWGGANLFSKNGIIQSGIKSARKEIGMGITPYKFVVARIGWSTSVGISFAAGVRVPI